MLLVLFALAVATAIANPVLRNEPNPMEDVSIASAVDFFNIATVSQFTCLKSAGYSKVFVQAYSPEGQGRFDNRSIANINNARAANFGDVEVYMFPQPRSSKSGGPQLMDTFNGLINGGGIYAKAVWLKVVAPMNWTSSYSDNIAFIQSFISQRNAYQIGGGIFTTKCDWGAITGNWNGASSLPLWYAHTSGPGLNGESPQNYNDFTPFGGWTAPAAKLYGGSEAVCGVSPLNRDVYTPGSLVKMEPV